MSPFFQWLVRNAGKTVDATDGGCKPLPFRLSLFPFSDGLRGPFLFPVLYSYNAKLWEFFP